MIVTAYKNRARQFTVTMVNSSGAIVPIQTADRVYVKIGRNQEEPAFELSSKAATANSSTVSAANPATVTLSQADLAALKPATYDMEVGILDDSDSDQMKHAEKGVFVLHGTMAGDDAEADFG